MRFLTTGLLASATLLGLAAAPAVAQANVLVLIADDLGTDAVGCYGLGLRNVSTPNIDGLAANGVRFTRAYMNPACSPTRGCIMTGRHGFRTGLDNTVVGNEPGLHANERTVAMALQGAYDTALIGKWHVGSRYGAATPNQFGFQHFAGTLDGGIPDYFRWTKIVNGQSQLCTNYATTDQVDDAVAWIGSRTAPWMLMVSFCAPHQPFHIPPASLHSRSFGGQTTGISPQLLFEAMVESLDTEIGRLLNSMPPGVRANTNIILVGDNGTDGALAVPPYTPTRMKGSLYEPGIRVPLIVSGPAVQSPGRYSSALVAAVDLFPTILDLCGRTPAQIDASPAGPIDGHSIRPLLDNTAPSIRSYVYIDMIYGIYGGGYAVVDDTHSLLRILYNGQQHQELYRLDTDPLQTTNLRSSTLVSTDPVAYQRLSSILANLRSDGWSENVGMSCDPGTMTPPSLRAQNFPRIGQLFVPQMINVPAGSSGLFLSAGRTTSTQALPPGLPAQLGAYGLTNCEAYTYDSLFWLALPPPVFGGYMYLPVPFVPEIVGVDFLLQAHVHSSGCNPASFVSTNGMHATIGW